MSSTKVVLSGMRVRSGLALSLSYGMRGIPHTPRVGADYLIVIYRAASPQ